MRQSLLPRFVPELETKFQEGNYERIRPLLRVLSLLLAGVFAAYTARDYADTQSWKLALTQDGSPTLFFLLIFGLTWVKCGSSVWQKVIVAGGIVTSAISLTGLASYLAATHPTGLAAGGPSADFSSESLFFGQQMRLLIVCFAATRLQFRQALLMQSALMAVGAWAFLTQPILATISATEISRFLQPTGAIFFTVLIAAFIEEQLARRAFLASEALEAERNDERRKRQQTEEKLQVLAQAIGGIVHDLGNPLTMVQMGASTLDTFIDQGVDKATLKEFTGAIKSGSRMLNFLRQSLMEQTRVLEGKPTPVNLRPIGLRTVLDLSIRFQRFPAAGTREINIDCEDVLLRADEMKLVTIFMNFIGNALKYSDGEIRIAARLIEVSGEARLLVTVLDMGKEGKGISRAQAETLFTAFGRLSQHSQIEGTGLGLLSVQNIAAAHGGEAFIEGYEDGTWDSMPYSTAKHIFPSLLRPGFRTAFVVSVAMASQDVEMGPKMFEPVELVAL